MAASWPKESLPIYWALAPNLTKYFFFGIKPTRLNNIFSNDTDDIKMNYIN